MRRLKVRRSTESDAPDLGAPQSPGARLPTSGRAEVDVEFLRRVYANNREWYTVAETKAQLLLAVDGVFISIVFGAFLGNTESLRNAMASTFGPETWVSFGVTVTAVVSAVTCAALSMWSLHGKVSRKQFDRLEVDPQDSETYKPEVLWYFGHLAYLRPEAATERLRRADRTFEIDVLSYHVVELSGRVLRKHRYVNAGWAFTALALIALTVAGISLVLRTLAA